MSTAFDAYSFYRLTSTVKRNHSTQQNLSCSITAATSHSTTTGSPTQVKSVTSGDKSAANYTMLGPVYDTIDSDGKYQALLSGKYDLGDTQYHNIVESSGGVPTKESSSVFPGQGTEHQDYAYAYLHY